jgi:hypothetical protein
VGWCELAERITLTLRLQPEYVQDDVRAQLGTVSAFCGGDSECCMCQPAGARASNVNQGCIRWELHQAGR